MTYKIHSEALSVRRYVTESGVDVFGAWLTGLADRHARARIALRIDRLSTGNLGDSRFVGHGVWELRIDWGPGHRVIGATTVLLLGGGDKRSQTADIQNAAKRLHDFRRRSA